MKGKITHINNAMSTGTITGDDGTKYFFHQSEFPKNRVKKGYVVEFDAVDVNKKSLKAINIKLIAYGPNHPFCNPIINICRFIEQNTPDSEYKDYSLRDLQMLYEYFANIEDTNVHGLREKYRPKEYTLNKQMPIEKGKD